MPLFRKILASLKKFLKPKEKAPARKRKFRAVKGRKKGQRPGARPRRVLRRKKPVGSSLKPEIRRGKRQDAKRAGQHAPVHRGASAPAGGRPGHVVGEITHYFPRIQVVVVKVLRGPLRVGDTIRIKGRVTDFTQVIRSMQIESVDVQVARKGHLIGLKIGQEARVGDKIYK